MDLSAPPTYSLRFLIHILVGVFLFAVVALAATVLWYATGGDEGSQGTFPDLVDLRTGIRTALLFGRYLPAVSDGGRGLEVTSRCLGNTASGSYAMSDAKEIASKLGSVPN